MQLIQTYQYPQPYLRDFDQHGRNKFLAHTFTGVAPDPSKGTVEEASLELRIRPTISITGYSQDYGIPSTDSISLAFLDNSGNALATGWSRRLGLDIVYNIPGLLPGQWLKTHPAELLQLNLNTLPNADGSTTSLIQALVVHDFLDVSIGDDSTVDYLKLRVRHSCLPLSITPVREPLVPAVLSCPADWPEDSQEFLAGVDDNFAGGTETASPSSGLQQHIPSPPSWQGWKDFDENVYDSVLGHTFTNVVPSPGTIKEAYFELRVKPNSSAGGWPYAIESIKNDSINLSFIGNDGNPLASGWSRNFGLAGSVPGLFVGLWTINSAPELLQLDLSALPNSDGSTTNLLQTLQAQKFLDLWAYDETVVDYAKLRVVSCHPKKISAPVEITPICTSDIWECGIWGRCSAAGIQTRTCILKTDCPGVRIPKPAEEQVCTLQPVCTKDIWECGRWSDCSAAGAQTRTCSLGQDCPFVSTPKPAENQTCVPPPPTCVGQGQACSATIPCCEGTCAPSFGAYGVCQPAAPTCAQIGQACGAATPCCEGECNAAGICAAAAPACAQTGQSCGGAVSCCNGLICASSGAGYLACQEPSPPPPPEPPDLEVEKLLNSAFHFGSPGSFTIIVNNVGKGTATSPITITDELPDGLTYQSFSSPYSTDWSCTASGQKVTCVYSGPDLSPGGFLPTLIINVAIASTADFPATMGDQVENCAIVEHPSDTNSNNNQSCVTAIVTSG